MREVEKCSIWRTKLGDIQPLLSVQLFHKASLTLSLQKHTQEDHWEQGGMGGYGWCQCLMNECTSHNKQLQSGWRPVTTPMWAGCGAFVLPVAIWKLNYREPANGIHSNRHLLGWSKHLHSIHYWHNFVLPTEDAQIILASKEFVI